MRMSGMSLGGSDVKDKLEESVSAAMTFSGLRCQFLPMADEIDAVWMDPSI